MLIAFIVAFAVIAAFLNALAVVIQRYEAGTPEPSELFRKDFSKNLSKNPKWIAAFGLEIFAFLCTAVALRDGSLILVEPLLTVDLVFLIIILHFYKHVTVGKRELLAIAMICLGLSAMLISASPHASGKPYLLSRLIVISVITALVISVCIYIVRRNSSSRVRAAITAVAAGFSFALAAVFTKIVVRQLGNGPLFVLSHWQVWALLVTGILSVIMTQNAYGSGPIAVSQPTMEIVEPVLGILLGVYVFGDSINLGFYHLLFAALAAIVAGFGIALLSRSKKLQIDGY